MDNSYVLLTKISKRNDKIRKLQQEIKLLSIALVAEEKLKQLEK